MSVRPTIRSRGLRRARPGLRPPHRGSRPRAPGPGSSRRSRAGRPAAAAGCSTSAVARAAACCRCSNAATTSPASTARPRCSTRARDEARSRRPRSSSRTCARCPVLGAFDLVWSVADGFNCLLDERELEAAFAGCARNLAPGGVVVFDVDTLAASGRLYSSLLVAPSADGVLIFDGQAAPSSSPAGRRGDRRAPAARPSRRGGAARGASIASVTTRGRRSSGRSPRSGLELRRGLGHRRAGHSEPAARRRAPQQGRLPRPRRLMPDALPPAGVGRAADGRRRARCTWSGRARTTW